MLGRKSFTQEEIDHAKASIDQQVEAYKALAKAAGADKKSSAALAAFEPLFFNNLALALDRYFVHRVRGVTGKDGTPLNELEVIVESLMNSNGVVRAINVIQLIPAESVLKLKIGDPIWLSVDDFERLVAGCFAELEAKFL